MDRTRPWRKSGWAFGTGCLWCKSHVFTTSWACAFSFIVLLFLKWIKKSLWENDDFNQAKGISGGNIWGPVQGQLWTDCVTITHSHPDVGKVIDTGMAPLMCGTPTVNNYSLGINWLSVIILKRHGNSGHQRNAGLRNFILLSLPIMPKGSIILSKFWFWTSKSHTGDDS